MDKKKFKRTIAREGLIFIVIALILYCASIFLFPKINLPAPQYRLELANSEIHYLDITPEIKDNENTYTKGFLKKLYQPSASLIIKRIEEFKRRNNIDVLNATPYSSWSTRILRGLSFFIMSGLFFQIIVAYFFISIIRFIIWALMTLRER